METTEIVQTIQIPREFRQLFNTEWRNILYYGGRGSTKSHSVARALLIRGLQEKKRILCTREFQNSIEDSSYQLLVDLIIRYELDEYEYTKNSIYCKITGSTFIFKGLKKGTGQSVKSLEGIDICWIEEAQSISEESLDILSPTIRNKGSQLIFTFNRMQEQDPVYMRYVNDPPPNTYSKLVNFDVAERAGFFPEVLRVEMEEDRRKNPDLFAHKWLGEPVAQGDRAILTRTSVIGAMDREVDTVGAVEVGVDVARYGDDRSEFVKRKGLTETARKTYTKLSLTDLADQLEVFVDFNKEILIKVDDTGVGGGLTDIMIERGYNVMAINFGAKPNDPDKYPNLISEAWFYLAEIIDTISLTNDSNLLMELTSRQWVMDSRGRRGVESKDVYKKRGNRSPDKADATILCFYTPQVPIVEWGGAR
jgi:phage terminase large subunit